MDPVLTCRMMVAALLLTAALGCASGSQSAALGVWTVDDGEKIFRDDLNSPLKRGEGNSVWDGHKVRLFAARNEVVAFQLILEAGEQGAEEVNVTVSELRSAKSRIRGSHPLPKPGDYVGLGVELFAEHYLHVERPSYDDPERGGFNWSAAANPKLTGWIPDALIPFSAARGKGGAPFDIGPSRNQGVWVDVYVGKDLPAGLYTGTITVSVGGREAAALPLDLEVLELTLPDQNHYRSMVYYSDSNIAARHGVQGRELWAMILRYHQMAHRHRIELIGSGSWEELQALQGTLSGEAFTSAAGYQGPGEGVGNTVFSVNTYGVRFPDSEEAYQQESDRWVSWFEEHAPNVDYFLYLTDEPRRNRYEWIEERAAWIHDNPGPGRKLPVFVTTAPREALFGSVDIWCAPTSRYRTEAMEQAKSRDEPLWIYAAYRPMSPADMIDEYGVAFRLKPWIAHQHGIPRWFTWESTHWFPNQNEANPAEPRNIFVNPVTFTSGPPSTTGNGDGTMFYPGQDRVFPDQDRGYPGPMSSVRMKMYRRGIQDVEYMWLAEQAGHRNEAAALVRELLPSTMWEAGETPSWSNRNADYEQARRRLADLISSR